MRCQKGHAITSPDLGEETGDISDYLWSLVGIVYGQNRTISFWKVLYCNVLLSTGNTCKDGHFTPDSNKSLRCLPLFDATVYLTENMVEKTAEISWVHATSSRPVSTSDGSYIQDLDLSPRVACISLHLCPSPYSFLGPKVIRVHFSASVYCLIKTV